MFSRKLPPSWRTYQRTLQSKRRERLGSAAGIGVIVVLLVMVGIGAWGLVKALWSAARLFVR